MTTYRRILVTGGSGFIGTNLVESLRNRYEVTSFDSRAPMIDAHRASWIEGDILDTKSVNDAFALAKPDVVVHLGARTDLKGSKTDDYLANTVGVQNIIEAGARQDSKLHTIYASSRLVFAIGHTPTHTFDYAPSTYYGESKILGEQIVRAKGSEAGGWTIVRPTSIWGPWFGTPYRDFFDTISRRRYVNMPGVHPKKSFGFVGNTVHEIESIFKAPPEVVDQNVYWLTDYPALDLREWSGLIAEGLDIAPPRTAPKTLVGAAAKVGDLVQWSGLVRDPPITSFRFRNLISDMVYDTASLEALVGRLPFSVADGVEATVSWIKEHG